MHINLKSYSQFSILLRSVSWSHMESHVLIKYGSPAETNTESEAILGNSNPTQFTQDYGVLQVSPAKFSYWCMDMKWLYKECQNYGSPFPPWNKKIKRVIVKSVVFLWNQSAFTLLPWIVFLVCGLKQQTRNSISKEGNPKQRGKPQKKHTIRRYFNSSCVGFADLATLVAIFSLTIQI